jgi:hypothetical protein
LPKKYDYIETYSTNSNTIFNYCEVNNSCIPEEYRIKNLLKKTCLKEFMRTSRTSPGIHFSIVAPNDLDHLTVDYFHKYPQDFISNINEEEQQYIDDIIRHKKKCLLADLIIRETHNFNDQPLPQIKHPRTNNMRKTIHDSVFVSTDLKGAATKFRTALDRQDFFADGKEWGDECYVYIISIHNMRRAVFVECGLAYGDTQTHRNIGKTRFPVCFDGCYHVQWNGKGNENALFTWLDII